jgi:hypothetical protein
MTAHSISAILKITYGNTIYSRLDPIFLPLPREIKRVGYISVILSDPLC